MRDFITFTNPITNESINIDITQDPYKDSIINKLRMLPKAENGKWIFGSTLIHIWGGGESGGYTHNRSIKCNNCHKLRFMGYTDKQPSELCTCENQNGIQTYS